MATYKEYITLALNRFNVDENTINLLLINQGQIIADPDVEVDVKAAKLAICRELAMLIPTWSQISEGDSSVSLNMDAIKMWYEQLCDELGIVPSTRVIVSNISYRW